MAGQLIYPAIKKIIIVGGGYGGKQLAHDLIQKSANVTIIDAKDSFHHNVAGVRTLVDESYARKMFIPYKPTFSDKFVQGTVTMIDPKTQAISLKDGKTITYDALVLATGSLGPFKDSATKREDSIALYSQYANAVKSSKSLLFIGGGPIGVEAACEVATDFPDKSVTIIHASDILISRSAPPDFTKNVQEIIKTLGVCVIYSEKVENLDKIKSGVPGTYEVVTNKGRKIKADIVFKTTGLSINKEAYAGSLGSAMEPNGSLKVNQFLQVEGHQNIFAIGDCNNLKLAKVAFIAAEEAKYLSENLAAFLENKPMQPWDAGRVGFYMALAMGRNHAVGALANGTILPEQSMIDLKSKDLLVARYYEEMKQTIKD